MTLALLKFQNLSSKKDVFRSQIIRPDFDKKKYIDTPLPLS